MAQVTDKMVRNNENRTDLHGNPVVGPDTFGDQLGRQFCKQFSVNAEIWWQASGRKITLPAIKKVNRKILLPRLKYLVVHGEERDASPEGSAPVNLAHYTLSKDMPMCSHGLLGYRRAHMFFADGPPSLWIKATASKSRARRFQ